MGICLNDPGWIEKSWVLLVFLLGDLPHTVCRFNTKARHVVGFERLVQVIKGKSGPAPDIQDGLVRR
jgi:hypothetical protein